MHANRQGRRFSWKMPLLLLLVLGLVRNSELAPASKSRSNRSQSASSILATSSPTRRTEIGSPSELAWQAWLLVDAQTGAQSGLDSVSLRKITPKSVFIAPALTPCAEGYQADTMGRCVKNVNIDKVAHQVFLLERLNAMFANRVNSLGVSAGLSGNGNQKKQPSGPLQLNIPFQTLKAESTEAEDVSDPPLLQASGTLLDVRQSEKKKPQEVVGAIYEIKNETNLEEEETMFFRRNTSAPSADKGHPGATTKPDAVVPVAEFVEETSETTFSEVVDYKIPIDLKILNVSAMKLVNESEGNVTAKEDRVSNSTDISPTLVLLLSPTKLPNTVSPLETNDSQSINATSEMIAQMTNLTGNLTGKEVISVSVPDSLIPPLNKIAEAAMHAADRNESVEDHVDVQNASMNESQEVESIYDDEEEEDYVDATDLPEEDSAELEGGEILKHGEAGMTIPVRKIDRLHFDKHRDQSQSKLNASKESEIKKGNFSGDDVYVHLNDSVPAEKDEAGSNVSSEVSINGDFIVETTLLDVSTPRTPNTTKSIATNHTVEVEREDEDDFKETFDAREESSPAPEVILSPQDTHGTHEDIRNAELVAAPSSSESLLYDPNPRDQYSQEESLTEIRTMEAESSNNREITFPKTPAVEVSTKDSRPMPIGFRFPEDYTRHSSPVKPLTSYGRYASEEVNAIHNQDYKERLQFPHEDGLHSSTSTKSSVPIHQKSPYWWIPSDWRMDRQQYGHQFQTALDQRQKRVRNKPMLLRVWRTMPLLRDPSLYPSTGMGSHSDDVGNQQHQATRFLPMPPSVRLYKEMSTQDVNRVFTQKLGTPIGG